MVVHEGEMMKNRMKGSGKQIGAIAQLLGMTRQNLGHHLRKSQLDEDFKRLVQSKEKDIFHLENDKKHLQEDIPLKGIDVNNLSANHTELVHAHALQAEAILFQTKQGDSLVETNKILVTLLASSSAPLKIPLALSFPSEEILERMAREGVKEKLWKSADEGLVILGKLAFAGSKTISK